MNRVVQMKIFLMIHEQNMNKDKRLMGEPSVF